MHSFKQILDLENPGSNGPRNFTMCIQHDKRSLGQQKLAKKFFFNENNFSPLLDAEKVSMAARA
jgi:hypothetical protein